MRGGATRQGAQSQQRLAIKFETPKLRLYDNVDPDDFFSALPADFKSRNMPLLLLLTTEKPEAAQEMTELEQSVLRDENVALGARLFRSVRLKGDKIAKEHAHWATLGGKALPRVVVVGADGVKVGVAEGNDLSGSNVFKLMKKAAAKTYRSDLEKVVKESRSLLDEMDQIEAKLQLLAAQKKDAKPAKEKELAAEEAKLAEQMKLVQARELDLLKKFTTDKKVAKG